MPKIIENPREKILAAGKEILIQQGYEKFNIRQVAQACGMAVGTIYNYFPTKKDLVAQIMAEHWGGYLHEIDQIGASSDELLVKLRKIFEAFAEFVRTFRDVWSRANVHFFRPRSEVGVQAHRDSMGRLVAKVADVVRAGVEDAAGEIVLPLGEREFAFFLCQNFFMMAQMRRLEYGEFEKILRKVLG